jgi:hypothetical protein
MPTATAVRVPTAPTMIQPPPTGAIPDWLTMQRAILRDAPDNDTAIRWQLAGALEHITDLDMQLQELEAQIAALQQPTQPRRPTQWRPMILALLRERGAPMTAAAITQALDAWRPLTDTCRDMVQAGLLVQDNEHFMLPLDATRPGRAPDPAAVAASNGTAPKRRSKKGS